MSLLCCPDLASLPLTQTMQQPFPHIHTLPVSPFLGLSSSPNVFFFPHPEHCKFIYNEMNKFVKSRNTEWETFIFSSPEYNGC